jgi:hypothetical protein
MKKTLAIGIHEIISLIPQDKSLGEIREVLKILMDSLEREITDVFATNIDKIIISYFKDYDLKSLIE